MAFSGHTDTHPPHPVQLAMCISGDGSRPGASLNAMAFCAHASSQLRHMICRLARQSPEIRALNFHGSAQPRSNRDSGHASAQAPQKVHSPLEKSMLGNPPVDGTIIFSGQAARHSPQRVQPSTKRCVASHGSRTWTVSRPGRPLRKARLVGLCAGSSSLSVTTSPPSRESYASQLPGGPAMSWYIHTRKP